MPSRAKFGKPIGIPVREDEIWQNIGPPTPLTGCQYWTRGLLDTGYGSVRYHGRNFGAHRLAFMLYWGVSLPSWLCVLHTCDNRPCCNPDHLWIGTKADNNRDAKEKGRMATGGKHGSYTHPENRPRGEKHGLRRDPTRAARGERVGSAKLREAQVKEIRARLAHGEKQRPLAREYGVRLWTIQRINRGLTWKHLL
mgnify:CR=1 FL=1